MALWLSDRYTIGRGEGDQPKRGRYQVRKGKERKGWRKVRKRRHGEMGKRLGGRVMVL